MNTKSISIQTRYNLLSSLPIFLIGCGITIACLIVNGPCFDIPTWRLYLGVAAGAVFALFIALVSIVGLIKKIPDWSVTWISVFIIGLLMLLNFKLDTGILIALRTVLLLVSIALAICFFYSVASRPWHLSGLFGIGFSSVLTILLFFVATNVSHDAIKLGYYAVLVGLVVSAMLFFFNTNSKHRSLFIAMSILLNGGLIYLFDVQMQQLGEESQFVYLLFLSMLLLFSGILFRQGFIWIKSFINKVFLKKQ